MRHPRTRQRAQQAASLLIRGVIVIITVGMVILGVLAVIIVQYGKTDRAHPADVIIVLGGGEIGSMRRARHAAALYQQDYAPSVLCMGNIVTGEPFSEAERCAMVARENGVPAEVIVLDEISRSTEENAIQARIIMQAHGWQDAVLVSDNYHLWRATWVFKDKGITAWPSPAQITTGSLTTSETVYSVLREIAATGWHVGKSLLGLPYTRVGE